MNIKKFTFSLLIGFLCIIGTVYAEDIYQLKVNTEGLGQINIVAESEEIQFNDEYPVQSAVQNTVEKTKFKVGAKADEGWKFTKWTLDGIDYSQDETIIVEVNSNMDLIAVFESDDKKEITTDVAPNEESTDVTTYGAKESKKDNNMFLYIGISSAILVVIIGLTTLKIKKNS